jgi:uncharacterized repeat protein (TIGR01451 family)
MGPWQAVTGATGYEVEVLGLGDVVVLNGWHAVSEVCVEVQARGFCPRRCYLLLARPARNNLAEGAQSDLMSFSVGAPLLQIRVAVDAAPKSVSAGDTVTVTVTILNEGTAEAQNVIFSNVLPDMLDTFSFVASEGAAMQVDATQRRVERSYWHVGSGSNGYSHLSNPSHNQFNSTSGGEAISYVADTQITTGLILPAVQRREVVWSKGADKDKSVVCLDDACLWCSKRASGCLEQTYPGHQRCREQ